MKMDLVTLADLEKGSQFFIKERTQDICSVGCLANSIKHDTDSAVPRKHHFDDRSEKSSITSIVICEDDAGFVKLLHSVKVVLEQLDIADIRRLVPHLPEHLCQCGTTKTLSRFSQIDQKQDRFAHILFFRKSQSWSPMANVLHR